MRAAAKNSFARVLQPPAMLFKKKKKKKQKKKKKTSLKTLFTHASNP